MPLLSLNFSVTDAQLAEIETLRDRIERDEFLRLALELGIADFRDESIRAQKDGIYQVMSGQTQNYQKARTERRLTLPNTKEQKA